MGGGLEIPGSPSSHYGGMGRVKSQRGAKGMTGRREHGRWQGHDCGKDVLPPLPYSIGGSTVKGETVPGCQRCGKSADRDHQNTRQTIADKDSQ